MSETLFSHEHKASAISVGSSRTVVSSTIAGRVAWAVQNEEILAALKTPFTYTKAAMKELSKIEKSPTSMAG